MPVSKKRIKKKPTSKPNLRRQFRNDARKSMIKILDGVGIFNKTHKHYEEMIAIRPDLLSESTKESIAKLANEVTLLVKKADELANSIIDDTKKDIPVSKWEEEYLPKAVGDSSLLEDMLLNQLPTLVEALLVQSTTFLTGGGATDKDIGLEVSEINTAKDLDEIK